ncbi:hypothetical protein Ahy_A02g008141 [Arachis hypogaea]|uniref:Uncharacterized protein n=1 Tax=Arachis hypogaea TaxID=3818 RepID=A0A445EE11_ARAHY|nr:hypothetical protein Ahy_A02g008141 [Arachis hypogaea]
MESSDEEFDFETEVDLAELKKRPPYVCSLLKKISNVDKSNDSKHKGGKKYSFDISKSDQIFDIIFPEGRTLLSIKDLKGKSYYKFHQETSHSTNNYVLSRDLIQEAIMERRLKFDDGKKEMKVDSNPFYFFIEPYFVVNMVGFSYDFDIALGDFESNAIGVFNATKIERLGCISVSSMLWVSDGYEIAKNFVVEILSIGVTHSADIETLLEVVTLIFEVEPILFCKRDRPDQDIKESIMDL